MHKGSWEEEVVGVEGLGGGAAGHRTRVNARRRTLSHSPALYRSAPPPARTEMLTPPYPDNLASRRRIISFI